MRVIQPGGLIAPRRSGGTFGPDLTPITIPNLHGWFDARKEGLTNGGAVSTFTDRAPTPHNLTQPTGANQPLGQTGANGINGRPALLFDGVNDYLTTALNAFTGFSVGTFCFAVRTGAVVTPGPYDILTGVNSAVNAQIAMGFQGSVVFLTQTAATNSTPTAIAANTNYRLIFVYNGASSFIYINGVAIGPLSPGAGDVASYRLGADNGVGGPFNGLFGEGAFFNRGLTAAELAVMDLYLARGWGI